MQLLLRGVRTAHIRAGHVHVSGSHSATRGEGEATLPATELLVAYKGCALPSSFSGYNESCQPRPGIYVMNPA